MTDSDRVKEYDAMSKALRAWFVSQEIEPAMAATVLVYTLANMAAQAAGQNVEHAMHLLETSHKSAQGICIASIILNRLG